MCTYEDLVDVTLAHGLIPLVVPQLRTITLGGAVSGLGIEATSFRSGLPHESVREMDVLTGAGEVVTTRPGEDLFDTFPNSYGSLGYATRLRIELEPVPAVRRAAARPLRRRRAAGQTVAEIDGPGHWDGDRVDALDGVAFEPGATCADPRDLARRPAPARPATTPGSRSTTARSQQRDDRPADRCHDYLWRWDTDWFWCSRAFGAQHPVVRRLWPRRLRRSDVYLRLLGLDRRFAIVDRLDRRAGRPQRERVVQDVEVPVDRLREFLAWFDERGRHAAGVAVPGRLRAPRRTWPSYPLDPERTLRQRRLLGHRHVGPDAPDARSTAPSRRRSTSSGATSACTPRRSTTRATSTRSTTAPTWPR